MNFKCFTLLCLVFTIAITSCKQKATSDSADADQAEQVPPVSQGDLKSIPAESMKALWDSCSAVDIIFYETNFSISQGDQPAIRNTLGYFLPSAVVHDSKCKPIGRITFVVDGTIKQEADIYHSPGCEYFIWMKDNKPAHINPMSPQGVSFFDQVMKQGKGQ